MSRLATFSRLHLVLAVAAFALFASIGGRAEAKVFLSTEEALRLAFPNATVERKTAFLTPQELTRARTEAAVEVRSAVVVQYLARRDGRLIGTAYFDTHRVRTLEETVLVVVDLAGKVARIETLSFREPTEYLPRATWYAQFLGRGLDSELKLDRAIRPVTGATLTATAAVAAVRRTLAIHHVLSSREKKP